MKFILILVASTLIASSTYAQSSTSTALDKKIRFGFKLDAGSSWLGPKESYVQKDGSKFYFSYGFVADFTLTENYIIATGLNISHAGGKLLMKNGYGLKDDGAIDNGKPNAYAISLQYLEIPFALKLKTDAIKGIKYYGQFGTYLGINLAARMDAEIDNVTYSKEKITGEVPVNMGLDLGIGIEYPFNNKTYGSFGLGFRNGFIDATKQSSWHDGKVNVNAFFLRTAIYF